MLVMKDILPKDAIDRRLITLASAKAGQISATELSKSVNGILSPAQAKLRLDHLLNSIDDFTVAQQHKLIIIEASNLLAAMREEAFESRNGNAQVRYLATLKFISDRLDADNLKVDDIVTRFSREHAKFFANAIIAAFELVRLELDARGVAIGDEDADSIINAAASKGLEAIEQVTISDE